MTENIEVYRQNSIRIKTDAGVVYIDPFKMDFEPHDADYILITHEHYDHFSPEAIDKVKKEGTILVVPKKMLDKAENKSGIKTIETVVPGEDRVIGNLKIETVPMYNIMKPFHPKTCGWVGYIIKTDGQRIYIAGDIDAIKEGKEVKCDIALVPVGGTYTMDAKKAAEFINEMNPETAIPVHYGCEVGSPDDGRVFAQYVKESIKVEIKIK